MTSRRLRTAIALATLCASPALPALANAEPYIPPGNSAATQYTETFPTSGGNVEVNSGVGGGRKGGSPAKALGTRTAKALHEHGAEGAALAALASESSGGPGGTVRPGGNSASGGRDHGHGGSAAGAASGGGGSGGGGSGGGESGGGGSGKALGQAEAPSGSSAAGQVISHGTLSSSGEMGIFLPLVLLAALLWAAYYVWRRRQPRPGGV